MRMIHLLERKEYCMKTRDQDIKTLCCAVAIVEVNISTLIFLLEGCFETYCR